MEKGKEPFPLEWEEDKEEGQLVIYLSDSTLTLDLPTYNKNFKKKK